MQPPAFCRVFSNYSWAGQLLASTHAGKTASKFRFLSQNAVFAYKSFCTKTHFSCSLSINQKELSSTQLQKKQVCFFFLNGLTSHGEMLCTLFQSWILYCQTTSDPQPELRAGVRAATGTCLLGLADKEPVTHIHQRALTNSKIKTLPYSKSHHFANKLLSTYIILC